MNRLRPPISPHRLALPGIVAAAALLVPAMAGHPAHAGVDSPARSTAQDYRLSVTDEGPPADITDAIRAHVADTALTVSTATDEPIMDIWFARELPAPAPPESHPGIAYGTLNEGVVLAVMRLHREHRDFRDQAVRAGVYVARYLRQPDDGNHLGETTYRDFAVLVSPDADSPGPQGFDETLQQALQLNLHPFAWGLWPAAQVPATETPGIATFQPGKWAVKLSLPRADGSALDIALVVVGNEWHY
jgi:hypothetical protein